LRPSQIHQVDGLNVPFEAVAMSETPIQKTRTKLGKMYGIGILVFSAIVGFVTLLAKFIANMNMT
jgi:hypothetical protein